MTTYRGEILEEARSLTEGDRNKTYGHPYDNLAYLGRLWGAYLGTEPIPAFKVAEMMTLCKMSRSQNRLHRDNHVDGAAYMAIAGECQMMDEAGNDAAVIDQDPAVDYDPPGRR